MLNNWHFNNDLMMPEKNLNVLEIRGHAASKFVQDVHTQTFKTSKRCLNANLASSLFNNETIPRCFLSVVIKEFHFLNNFIIYNEISCIIFHRCKFLPSDFVIAVTNET